MTLIFHSCLFILTCPLYWTTETNNTALEYLSGGKPVFVYEDFMVLYKSAGIPNPRLVCGKKKTLLLNLVGWTHFSDQAKSTVRADAKELVHVTDSRC